jgi:hypothetical protein
MTVVETPEETTVLDAAFDAFAVLVDEVEPSNLLLLSRQSE